MIDGSYHIEDVDEVGESSSIGDITKEDKTVIKTKVIYENSNTSEESDSDRESEQRTFFYDNEETSGQESRREKYREYEANRNFDEKADYGEYRGNNGFNDEKEDYGEYRGNNGFNDERADYREYRANNEFKGGKSGYRRKTFVEEWFIDLYQRRPNTLKATIIGVVLALLILFIGFLKTLLIFVVVLIANLIGQLLDSNPRLLYVINSIRQRFR